MRTLEVADKQWQQLCQTIQQVAHGAMVSVELVQPDGSSDAILQDVPLQRIAFDPTSDACNSRLLIEAGLPGQRPAQHVVIEPIHIRLKNGGPEERYHHLHILAENGTTIVVFHPGLNPDAVKGLER